MADAHTFAHRSPYAPTVYGQDWTFLDGTLLLNGIGYFAQFQLTGFDCPEIPQSCPVACMTCMPRVASRR